MTHSSSTTEWRTDQVPQEFVELEAQLSKLPVPWRARLMPLCDRLANHARLQQRLIRIAQDAVDQLQLDVKYLTFDLEVTRRERDEILSLLGFDDDDDDAPQS
jgi:hypothetical protein